MGYIINKTNGDVVSTLSDTLVDQTSTDITLIGKDVPNYGEYVNENFIKLLENFADNIQPERPITGQLWFDDAVKQLKVYDGNGFKSTSGVMVSSSAPSTIGQGDFWLNPDTNQLYFFNGANHLLGPIYKADQGMCGFKVETMFDDKSVKYVVMKVFVADQLIGIYSKSEFIPRVVDVVENLTILYPGFNAVNKTEISYHGIADAAFALLDETGTEVTMANFITTAGGTITGALHVIEPASDIEAVNLQTVKQRPLAISLNTAGLTNEEIALTYLNVLFPTVDYQTAVDGPICRVYCIDTNIIKEYILTSGIWTFFN